MAAPIRDAKPSRAVWDREARSVATPAAPGHGANGTLPRKLGAAISGQHVDRDLRREILQRRRSSALRCTNTVGGCSAAVVQLALAPGTGVQPLGAGEAPLQAARTSAARTRRFACPRKGRFDADRLGPYRRLARELDERSAAQGSRMPACSPDGRTALFLRRRGARLLMAIDLFSSPPMVTLEEGELGDRRGAGLRARLSRARSKA